MQANKHPEYEEEVQQLHYTNQWVVTACEKLKKEEEQLEAELFTLRKEASSAVDERLILKEQMYQMLDADIDKMNKIRESPYFGRIDFQEKLHSDTETIYIGKFGIYDPDKGEMLVLDWRAPMSNIYYSGMDALVSYKAPKGVVEGEMKGKRRYVLEQGELLEIHDEKTLQEKLRETIPMESAFLIDALTKSTQGRLKEIVATIQQQQNEIIRSDACAPLIVQGVAGSGKTTIALHRMAYIIYNRQQDKEAKYMVVAPNKLFLNYIAAILPELGVGNVVQTTFEAWALGVLGKGYKLSKNVDQLDTLLTTEEAQAKIMALTAKFKGSVALKKIIDLKLRMLEHHLVPKEHIRYNNMILFTYKEIQNVFLVSNQHLDLNGRIKQLGEYLKKRLKDKENLIKQSIENVYHNEIELVKLEADDIEHVRPQIRALYDERDTKIKAIRKWIPSFVKNYLEHYRLPSVVDFYKDILDNEDIKEVFLGQYGNHEKIDEMLTHFKCFEADNLIETEDLGPLVYIQLKLYGVKNIQK